MASLAEVSKQLVSIISQTIYPNGIAAASLTNQPTKIYAGWPLPDVLDRDLPSGICHVCIWPLPGDVMTNVAMGDMGWQEVSNTGANGKAAIELRRQTRRYQISFWANRPEARDILADAVDPVLQMTPRFTMSDESQAILRYLNSAQVDSFQKRLAYRRDLFYSVNYATTFTEAAIPIETMVVNLSEVDVAISSAPALDQTIEIKTTSTGSTITITGP